jgi:hypothetical protein
MHNLAEIKEEEEKKNEIHGFKIEEFINKKPV